VHLGRGRAAAAAPPGVLSGGGAAASLRASMRRLYPRLSNELASVDKERKVLIHACIRARRWRLIDEARLNLSFIRVPSPKHGQAATLI